MRFEYWRPIPGFRRAYWLSIKGRLWSLREQEFVHPRVHAKGYAYYRLRDDRGRIVGWKSVHRLMGIVWPNHLRRRYDAKWVRETWPEKRSSPAPNPKRQPGAKPTPRAERAKKQSDTSPDREPQRRKPANDPWQQLTFADGCDFNDANFNPLG